MAGKESCQVEIQVPLKRLWAALNDPNLLAKAFPGYIESVEILEGDGSASTGSIRKINFSPGAVPDAMYSKEKIEMADPERHTLVIVVLEGGSIGTHYSSTKSTYKFSAGDGDTTILHWEFEYEAIVDDLPVPNAKEKAIRMLKAIEAYLTSNKELYTSMS